MSDFRHDLACAATNYACPQLIIRSLGDGWLRDEQVEVLRRVWNDRSQLTSLKCVTVEYNEERFHHVTFSAGVVNIGWSI